MSRPPLLTTIFTLIGFAVLFAAVSHPLISFEGDALSQMNVSTQGDFENKRKLLNILQPPSWVLLATLVWLTVLWVVKVFGRDKDSVNSLYINTFLGLLLVVVWPGWLYKEADGCISDLSYFRHNLLNSKSILALTFAPCAYMVWLSVLFIFLVIIFSTKNKLKLLKEFKNTFK